jgi:hypothetical protein
MPDWEREKCGALLEAAKTAITRNRYVFGAVNLGAIVMLSAQFNAMVPWIRNTIERAKDEKVRSVLTDLLWRDFGSVSLPVVGIKFSTADLQVIGAIGMAILAVWMFYAARRENHVISAIAQEAQTALQQDDLGKAQYLYHGIAHYFVFTTVTDRDTPGGEQRSMARLTVRALLFSPFWVPMTVLIVDLVSLFFVHKVALDPNAYLWDLLTRDERMEVVIRLIVCTGISWFSYVRCRDCDAFDANTRTQLDYLRTRVEPYVPSIADH